MKISQHSTRNFLVSFALVISTFLQLFSQTIVTYQNLHTQTTFDNKTVDTGKPVGSIGANVDVSNGSATYTIPIQIPAGTNAVQPSIAISYQSQGGDGLLGRGWGLIGLSMITRNIKSFYHDGYVGPATIDANDRFALDGMRLIATLGTYGAANTSYSKEMEDFSRTTSYGTSGSGPTYFIVETKEGVEYEYGNTPDSRFMAANNTDVLFWRLNKVKYKDGNYIEYVYNNSDYESKISEIRYTGNSLSNPVITPYNKIVFNYQQRSNNDNFKTITYEADKPIKLNSLLTSIDIITDNTILVKKYKINYGNDNVNVFLTEVIEIGSDGTTEFNSTIFKYGDKPSNYLTSSFGLSSTNGTDLYSGDFNGDGISDIMQANRIIINNKTFHNSFNVILNLPSGQSLQYQKTLPHNGSISSYGSNYNFFSSDFNGDGNDDIAYALTSDPLFPQFFEKVRLYIHNNNASSATEIDLTLPNPSSNFHLVNINQKFFTVGDYNGDGIKDVLIIMAGPNGYDVSEVYIWYGNSSINTFSQLTLSGSAQFPLDKWQTKNLNTLDFDGDGKDEVMITRGSYSEIFSISATAVNSIKIAGFPTEYHLMFFGDFNGDRKTDLLTRGSLNDNTTSWYTAYSTGKNWIENSFIFPGNYQIQLNENYQGDKLITGDFNGDGKSDIISSQIRIVNQPISVDYFLHCIYSYGDKFYSVTETLPSQLSSYTNLVGDFNGDGKTDFLNRASLTSNSTCYYMNKEGEELLLQKIKNGENHVSTISYERLTEIGPHYTKSGVTAYPYNTIRTPMYVPSTLTKEGVTFKKYEYTDAILHRSGKGLLGFKKIEERSGYANVLYISENELMTLHAMLIPKKIINKFTNISLPLINERIFTNTIVQQNTGALQKILWHKIPIVEDYNITEGTAKTATNIEYDTDGNVTLSSLVTSKKVGSIYTTVETNNVTSTFIMKGSFRKNVPETVTTTNTRLMEAAFSQTVKYEYNTKGQTTKKTDFFGETKELHHTYTYNDLGNILTITLSSTGLANRATSSTYDTKGRFVISSNNALNQTSTSTYDAKWAKPLQTLGVDGIKTNYEYDVFGRLKKTTYYKDLADAFDVNVNYTWSTVSGTSYYIETVHPGKPDIRAYYDKLGRNVQTETQGFGGNWITEKKSYDLYNRVETTTGPHRPALTENGLVTTFSYDNFNRVTSESNSLKTVNYTYAYANGEKTVTATLGSVTPTQSTTSIYDASGKIISTTDNGGTLTYEYFSHGNIKNIKNGTTVYSSMMYDVYARQTQLTDINAGTTTYEYNAYGELIKENSPSGNDTRFTYNQLGQVTLRTHKESGITKSTTYTYYTTGVAKNKLATITNFANSYTETYNYDVAYGRLSSKVEFVDANHTTSYSYNKYDDVLSITFPSAVVINYGYDANGYINTIKNGTTTLFTNQGMTPYGNYKNYLYGNGLEASMNYNYTFPIKYLVKKETPTETIKAQDLDMVWDYKTGNLASRTDLKSTVSKTEIFLYDNLNRLISSQVGSNTLYTYNYSPNGNLTEKSDAVGAGGLEYLLNPKINAVSRITNQLYPAISNDAQSISFFSYQRPNTINETGKSIYFYYGSDYQRRKSIFKTGTTTTETRYYFDNYEKQVIGSTTRHIHYVSNGEKLISIIVKENTNAPINYFAITDHLGSIVAVTNPTVTSLTNCFQAQQNFDVWGRNRNVNDWTYNSPQAVPVWLYRGFTGHEHYPHFTLINMNARLYDPGTGRMLSPDIAVTMPYSSQGYNRYSYANNNPLKYTDPSGNFVTEMIVAAAIAITTNGISNLIQQRGFFDNWLKAAIIGAVSGGISAGIGSYAQFLSQTGVSKASVTITQALMHGTTSMMMSMVQSGNAVSGFSSGLISSLTSSSIQLAKGGDALVIIGGGVSGGIGAAITGGNFYQGFSYGLISGALNHAAHDLLDIVNDDKPKKPRNQNNKFKTGFQFGLGYTLSSLFHGYEVGIVFANRRSYLYKTKKFIIGKNNSFGLDIGLFNSNSSKSTLTIENDFAGRGFEAGLGYGQYGISFFTNNPSTYTGISGSYSFGEGASYYFGITQTTIYPFGLPAQKSYTPNFDLKGNYTFTVTSESW